MNALALVLFSAIVQSVTVGHVPVSPTFRAVSAQAAPAGQGWRPVAIGAGYVRALPASACAR